MGTRACNRADNKGVVCAMGTRARVVIIIIII